METKTKIVIEIDKFIFHPNQIEKVGGEKIAEEMNNLYETIVTDLVQSVLSDAISLSHGYEYTPVFKKIVNCEDTKEGMYEKGKLYTDQHYQMKRHLGNRLKELAKDIKRWQKW